MIQRATVLGATPQIAEEALLCAWEEMARMRFAKRSEIRKTLNDVLRRWDELEKQIKKMEKE